MRSPDNHVTTTTTQCIAGWLPLWTTLQSVSLRVFRRFLLRDGLLVLASSLHLHPAFLAFLLPFLSEPDLIFLICLRRRLFETRG